MHFNQWTFVDVLFTGIVLVSTGFALMKGLVREIISIVALIGGFILAVLYYPDAGSWLAEFSKSDSVANFAGFLLIFLGCILIGAITSFIVNRFVKAASLKWIDRLLGGVFGLLRGWAIASILVIALIAFPIRENLISRSVLAPYLLAGARAAILLVPKNLKDKFEEQYKKVLHSWNESGGAA
jgi:membrane protein required for colicin V production